MHTFDTVGTCIYCSAQNNQNAMLGHFGRPFSVFDSTEQELYTWQECNSAYATLSIDTSTMLKGHCGRLLVVLQGHFGNLVGN